MELRIAALAIAATLTTGAAAADPPSFRNLDANDDGQLTLAEAAADTRISRDFERADRNRDYRLDREEFEAARRMPNQPARMQPQVEQGAKSDGKKHGR